MLHCLLFHFAKHAVKCIAPLRYFPLLGDSVFFLFYAVGESIAAFQKGTAGIFYSATLGSARLTLKARKCFGQKNKT